MMIFVLLLQLAVNIFIIRFGSEKVFRIYKKTGLLFFLLVFVFYGINSLFSLGIYDSSQIAISYSVVLSIVFVVLLSCLMHYLLNFNRWFLKKIRR
jgi:hypothetical protein